MKELVTHDRRMLLTVLLSNSPEHALAEDDRASTFLRHLLTQPTRNVYRRLALPWPPDSKELVHTARVSSRRLVEALALASPAIGRSRARRSIRRARALRRAFGAAREAHVMLSELRRLARRASLDEEATHGLDVLRACSGSALEEASKTYPPERLLTEGIDILTLAESPKRALSLRAVAAPHLFRRAGQVRSLLACMEEPTRVSAHHQLRIRFKSLRYTVEILATPFNEALDAHRVVLQTKALQDALGELNDAQDLLAWLGRRRVAERVDPESLESLREVVEREREARFKIARDAVNKVGRKLAAHLQRSAGKIGRL